LPVAAPLRGPAESAPSARSLRNLVKPRNKNPPRASQYYSFQVEVLFTNFLNAVNADWVLKSHSIQRGFLIRGILMRGFYCMQSISTKPIKPLVWTWILLSNSSHFLYAVKCCLGLSTGFIPDSLVTPFVTGLWAKRAGHFHSTKSICREVVDLYYFSYFAIRPNYGLLGYIDPPIQFRRRGYTSCGTPLGISMYPLFTPDLVTSMRVSWQNPFDGGVAEQLP
jgi:hypothetical protein